MRSINRPMHRFSLLLPDFAGFLPVNMALFTPEIAKAMSAKGHAARRQIEHERKLADIAAKNLLLHIPPPSAAPLAPPDAYTDQRLSRTRRQIALLEEQIEKLLKEDAAENAQAIDRLVSSKARLSEEERILAGRPLPGSHRPRSDSRRPRAGSVEPLPE